MAASKSVKAAQEPFHGYKLSMTLNNQLGLNKDSLVKALNGKEKRVTTTRLGNTMHDAPSFLESWVIPHDALLSRVR
jgi:hypothetical protein